MKIFNLVSMLSITVVLATSAIVQAQNFRSPYNCPSCSTGPTRTFLGLPLPQQWTGTRPASMTQYPGNRENLNNRNYGQSSSCADGQCPTGNCSNGKCSTGRCSNGQCTTNRPIFSQGTNANCTNGQCRLNQSPNGRSYSNPEYEAQDNWSPRTTRSNITDPFRSEEYQNRNDQGMQRSEFRNPVNDLLPSRYNANDLDLRRPYFNDQSSELINNRPSETSSGINNVWAPLPGKRSLIGVPADRAYGVARI